MFLSDHRSHGTNLPGQLRKHLFGDTQWDCALPDTPEACGPWRAEDLQLHSKICTSPVISILSFLLLWSRLRCKCLDFIINNWARFDKVKGLQTTVYHLYAIYRFCHYPALQWQNAALRFMPKNNCPRVYCDSYKGCTISGPHRLFFGKRRTLAIGIYLAEFLRFFYVLKAICKLK